MPSLAAQTFVPIVILDDENEQDSVIDLVSDDSDNDSDSTLSGEPNNSLRNGPILLPSILLEDKVIITGNLRLKKGDSIELEDGCYFRIVYIIKNLETDVITFRGWRFRGNGTIKNRLQNLPNEICLVGTVDKDDLRPTLTQCMEDITPKTVRSTCSIVMTNEVLPEHLIHHRSARPQTSSGSSETLTCRWVSVKRYKNSEHRQRNERRRRQERCYEEELRSLNPSECDEGQMIPNAVLLKAWLGYIPTPNMETSFADAFCGLGGVSLGASDAVASSIGGVQLRYKVKWAFDNDRHAVETYQLNRPDTNVWLANAHDMISLITFEEHHVAVLHISPPCQPFSRAHTRPGQRDEENQATLFAVCELIKRVRPRVVTLEEVDNLMNGHPVWFSRLIEMFTTLGYSVKWKICGFADDGLCYVRNRLIIIASCPGVTLPPFPTPKFGPESPGQRPYRTIADALAPLNSISNPENHDVQTAAQTTRGPAYSPHTQLRGAITCNGGTSWHPSGRAWTVREYAMLQALPVWFKFGRFSPKGKHIKQIGNLVPSVGPAALLKEINVHLYQEDLDRQFEARL